MNVNELTEKVVDKVVKTFGQIEKYKSILQESPNTITIQQNGKEFELKKIVFTNGYQEEETMLKRLQSMMVLKSL